jgi:hypothetical protein
MTDGSTSRDAVLFCYHERLADTYLVQGEQTADEAGEFSLRQFFR